MTILLDNVSVDTDGTPVKFNGGPGVIYVRGDNFGGGTVDIQIATGDDSALRFGVLADGSFTGEGTVKIDYLATGSRLKAVLSGSTGASNVFVAVSQ